MKLSISEAARRAGVKRMTIYRKIENGKLSKETGANGKSVIDFAELTRLYPNAVNATSQTMRQFVAGKNTQDISALHDLVAMLKQDKERLTGELDQQRLASQADMAREREERYRLMALLETLQHQLTDQRPSAQETTLPRRKWFRW